MKRLQKIKEDTKNIISNLLQLFLFREKLVRSETFVLSFLSPCFGSLHAFSYTMGKLDTFLLYVANRMKAVMQICISA